MYIKTTSVTLCISDDVHQLLILRDEFASIVGQDIDWLRYLNLVFANISTRVDLDEPVVLYNPEYMQQIALLIQDTPNRCV